MAVLDDPSGALTIGDVSGDRFSGSFSPVQAPFYTAVNDVPVWVRLTLRYPGLAPAGTYVLDLSWDFIRALDAFFPFQAGAEPVLKGDFNVFVDSAINLPRPSGAELTVFVRLVGYNGIHVNPAVIDQTGKTRHAELRKWLLGMMFGVMAAMFVYNLFLFISLRDPSYLWYISHTLFVSLFYMITNGLGFFLEKAESLDAFLHNLSVLSVVCVFMFCSIGLFARSFLQTYKNHPVLERILWAQIGSCAILLVVLAAFGPVKAMELAPYVGVITSAAIVSVGTARLVQGFRPASVLLGGWAFYVACGLTHALAWAGVLPPTPFTVYIAEAGSSVEVMVMALALAYRVTILRQERERALRDIGEIKSLEKCRADVERLIRHDIKSPLSSLLQLAQQTLGNGNEKLFSQCVPLVIPAIRQVIHLVDASEKILLMEQGRYVPQGGWFDLGGVLANVASALDPVAKAHGVRMVMAGGPDPDGPGGRRALYGEEFLIENMLMNLVKNAIEASPPGGEVTVSHGLRQEELNLEIHNRGVVPEAVRERFFDKYATYGKPGGKGLGTYSARLIAKAHGGGIGFTTSEAEGTTVHVVLPKASDAAPDS